MQHLALIFVTSGLLVFVVCAPVDNTKNFNSEIKAIENINEINPDGSYHYRYYLDTGAKQDVTGTLKEVNGEKVYSVEGSYSYRQEDGRKLIVTYIADENGFRILSSGYEVPQVVYSINPKSVASLLGG